MFLLSGYFNIRSLLDAILVPTWLHFALPNLRSKARTGKRNDKILDRKTSPTLRKSPVKCSENPSQHPPKSIPKPIKIDPKTLQNRDLEGIAI